MPGRGCVSCSKSNSTSNSVRRDSIRNSIGAFPSVRLGATERKKGWRGGIIFIILFFSSFPPSPHQTSTPARPPRMRFQPQLQFQFHSPRVPLRGRKDGGGGIIPPSFNQRPGWPPKLGCLPHSIHSFPPLNGAKKWIESCVFLTLLSSLAVLDLSFSLSAREPQKSDHHAIIFTVIACIIVRYIVHNNETLQKNNITVGNNNKTTRAIGMGASDHFALIILPSIPQFLISIFSHISGSPLKPTNHPSPPPRG